MSRRKIKKGDHKPKVRGHRGQQAVQRNERERTRRIMQEQTRRRRMTRVDESTGEEYTLSRLTLQNKDDGWKYKDALDAAVGAADVTVEAQATAIQEFIQSWVDDKRLVPIPCGVKEIPVCKVYGGENKRVVVMRQDVPGVVR